MEHMHSGHTNHKHPPSSGPCNPNDTKRPPTCGVHNQMVIGTQTIYLSHLPMFMFDPQHHEHNFQVILEVTISGSGRVHETYQLDRQTHPDERMYTMMPEPFEMIELDPRDPKRAMLTGTIFRGHLERGGQPIIEAATAQVVNIVYFHKFEEDAQPLDQLEYLLFGKAPELFLAHVINRPPDFDQLLGVTVSGEALAADDLRRGIRIKIAGRANTPHTRIKAGERVTAQVQRSDVQTGQPLDLQLAAGTEFYFEEGELRLPMTMDQTPEERKAGF